MNILRIGIKANDMIFLRMIENAIGAPRYFRSGDLPQARKRAMKLLTPIQLGAVEVKNRVVSTAHAAYANFFRNGCDGERYMAYQERRFPLLVPRFHLQHLLRHLI